MKFAEHQFIQTLNLSMGKHRYLENKLFAYKINSCCYLQCDVVDIVPDRQTSLPRLPIMNKQGTYPRVMWTYKR